jgi:hypothetical protein
MTPMRSKRSKDRGTSTPPDAELPYRSLVERVPAIVYVDPVGPEPTSPTYVSPFVEQLLGYPAEVATGDPEWWRRPSIPRTASGCWRSGRRATRRVNRTDPIS